MHKMHYFSAWFANWTRLPSIRIPLTSGVDFNQKLDQAMLKLTHLGSQLSRCRTSLRTKIGKIWKKTLSSNGASSSESCQPSVAHLSHGQDLSVLCAEVLSLLLFIINQWVTRQKEIYSPITLFSFLFTYFRQCLLCVKSIY